MPVGAIVGAASAGSCVGALGRALPCIVAGSCAAGVSSICPAARALYFFQTLLAGVSSVSGSAAVVLDIVFCCIRALLVFCGAALLALRTAVYFMPPVNGDSACAERGRKRNTTNRVRM